MKTPENDTLDALAAQYVLGVLTEAARRRFERDMMKHWRVRQAVWYWERQLQTLAERSPAVAAPPHAWKALSHRLWPPRPSPVMPAWRHWFWPGWSLAATAVAILLLAVTLRWQTQFAPPVAEEQWLAVVQSAQAEPLWLVDTDARATSLRLKAVAAPTIEKGKATDKDYELWLLPQQGTPQSIGILPTGEVEITVRLSAEQFKALLQNKTLAISIEPKGGSPTGLPTGPVVYQSKLLKI